MQTRKWRRRRGYIWKNKKTFVQESSFSLKNLLISPNLFRCGILCQPDGGRGPGVFFYRAFFYNPEHKTRPSLARMKLTKLLETLVALGCDPAFIWRFNYLRREPRWFRLAYGLDFYYQKGFPVYIENFNIHSVRREAKYVKYSSEVPLQRAARLEVGITTDAFFYWQNVVVEIVEVTRLYYMDRLPHIDLCYRLAHYWPLWVHRTDRRDQLYVVQAFEFYVAPYHCRSDWFYDQFTSNNYYDQET